MNCLYSRKLAGSRSSDPISIAVIQQWLRIQQLYHHQRQRQLRSIHARTQAVCSSLTCSFIEIDSSAVVPSAMGFVFLSHVWVTRHRIACTVLVLVWCLNHTIVLETQTFFRPKKKKKCSFFLLRSLHPQFSVSRHLQSTIDIDIYLSLIDASMSVCRSVR